MQDINPDFIGVSVRSPVFPMYLALYGAIRQHLPECKIIIGGAHPTGDPEGCKPYADYVVVGDGEWAMTYILEGGKYYGSGSLPFTDLDILPFQYYGGDTYALAKPKPPERMSVYTTRGCSYSCSYCQESILKRKPVRKSVRYFKEEVDYYRTVFPGLTTLTITDPSFIYDLEWLEEFMFEFKGSGLNFWCAGHAQVVTSEMLELAKAAGVKSIRIGVQSGSKYIRETIFNRKETLEQVLDVAHKIKDVGITGQYDFIIDNPFDTPESLSDTRHFIKRLPQTSMINKFELRYWPGTEITAKALKLGYIMPDDVEGNFIRLGNWVYLYRLIMGEK
ncbi:MAG TPA: radical SAM protein [Spirochaetales bacterium]|nr:radical SAM protein [Spirochaetales bacterium]